MELHVVFGSGPIGCWTARALRAEGRPVRVVNRSGRRPPLLPDDVELVAADAASEEQAVEAARGATVVYQALNAPYHRWAELFPPLQRGAVAAARAAGARYVSIENLYVYDPAAPITADSPVRPRARKGELRARMAEELAEAARSGGLRYAALRPSDLYGPGVLQSALGERFFGSLVRGRRAQAFGAADQPHSWAYIEDVGRAAAALGTRDEALGKAWIPPHAPPATAAEVARLAATHLDRDPGCAPVPPWLMKLVGLFDPGARASVEMMYQFTAPFVVADEAFEAAFGLGPTPLADGVARTVAWYRERDAGSG